MLSKQLISLLNQPNIYWKQKATIKYATFGHGNIKFFQANATVKFIKNTITSLEDGNGTTVIIGIKRSLLWEAYKERLGKSEFASIQADVGSLFYTLILTFHL